MIIVILINTTNYLVLKPSSRVYKGVLQSFTTLCGCCRTQFFIKQGTWIFKNMSMLCLYTGGLTTVCFILSSPATQIFLSKYYCKINLCCKWSLLLQNWTTAHCLHRVTDCRTPLVCFCQDCSWEYRTVGVWCQPSALPSYIIKSGLRIIFYSTN